MTMIAEVKPGLRMALARAANGKTSKMLGNCVKPKSIIGSVSSACSGDKRTAHSHRSHVAASMHPPSIAAFSLSDFSRADMTFHDIRSFPRTQLAGVLHQGAFRHRRHI